MAARQMSGEIAIFSLCVGVRKVAKSIHRFGLKCARLGGSCRGHFWTITMRSLMFFEISLGRIIFCDWVLSEKCINQETQWHNRFFFCIFFSKFAIFCKMTTFWQRFATKTYILAGQKLTQTSQISKLDSGLKDVWILDHFCNYLSDFNAAKRCSFSK